jgi:hypothetical protein
LERLHAAEFLAAVLLDEGTLEEGLTFTRMAVEYSRANPSRRRYVGNNLAPLVNAAPTDRSIAERTLTLLDEVLAWHEWPTDTGVAAPSVTEAGPEEGPSLRQLAEGRARVVGQRAYVLYVLERREESRVAAREALLTMELELGPTHQRVVRLQALASDDPHPEIDLGCRSAR